MAESSSFKDSRWSLHGMTALVTGGTRGIGNATVEELAGLGARVHICSRNEEELTSGAGSIVFISSVADLVHLGAGSIYGASKGAMNQLARTLACEWAKDNIRTNCVAPWYIRTSLVAHFLDDKVFLDKVFSNPSPARWRSKGSLVPGGISLSTCCCLHARTSYFH